MPSRKRKAVKRPTALILVEGETEEEFYAKLLTKYCRSHPKKVRNLKGNFAINSKIVDAALSFSEKHPGVEFYVYVCIDQERKSVPAYNHDLCEKNIREESKSFQGIRPVIADLMCESLFFLDIDGIYKFLRTPINKRNAGKFSRFRLLTHLDLSKLFRENDKVYRKGRRCENFLSNLDLSKMLEAEEIRKFIDDLK